MLMPNCHLTRALADSIVRQLKSSQLPPEAKLELLIETWRDARLVMPRKERILLDLLCRELSRAAGGKSESAGSNEGASHLLPGYWVFLAELLRSIPESGKPAMVASSLLQV